MKNKKGGLTAPLIDFWSLVVFLLVAIAVFFIIKIQAERNELIINDEAALSDSKKILQNFLRTEVDVDGKTMTIADLIILVDHDGGYREKLIAEKNKILTEFLENSKYNCAEIYATGKNPIIESHIIKDRSFKGSCFSNVKKTVSATLPRQDGKITVKFAIE